MPRPPAPPRPERYQFAGRFDDPAWLIHGGWDSLAFLNLKVRDSWSGTALDMSGPAPALLAIPAKAADGRLNLSLEPAGTLRFYFSSDWGSGGLGPGPGGEARLLEFGAWSAQGQQTFCWLGVDGLGSTIRLVANGANGPVEILEAPIQWAAGEWHQVALVWSGGSPTVLYLDGLAVASGVGLDLSALESRYIGTGTPGFCIGSDGQGTRLAQGQFEEVYTFSRACTAEELAWNWQVQRELAALGPITEEEAKALLERVAQLKSMPPDEPVFIDSFPCSLRLQIARSTVPGEVIVTLHNTIPGSTYHLLSKEDLNLPEWTLHQSLQGTAGQNWTQTTVPLQGWPALFFMADGPAEYLRDTNFPGLDVEDTDADPPDTMGAVGPGHFVELLNKKIAVYDKTTGQPVAGPSNTIDFFRVGDFPRATVMVDPRIIYDHQSNRWVACAKEGSSTNVGLAISITDNPLPLDDGGWRKYEIPFLITTNTPVDTPDFTTLGVDANGIYISVHYNRSWSNRVVAIDKAKLYGDSPELVATKFDIPSSGHLRVIQPPVNFDPTPINDLVWLITKGAPETSGTYQGGALFYRRLRWNKNNGTVAWMDADQQNWQEVAESPGLPYRNYFDLDGGTIGAPQMGGPTTIALGPADPGVGSRLSMAVIRDSTLWTCHHVGLDDEVEGDYDGDGTGSSVDRSAIQWFRLHITGTGDLDLQNSNDQGRMWDRRVSQIAQPLPVGRFKTSGYAYGVQVAGSYAYVADGEAGLQVIDVSNPTKPLLVGGCDTSGSARGVHVVGSYAYVADGGTGLQVIDVSTPASPVWKGGYQTTGHAYGVHVVGSYGYVAAYDAGLQVIDVSNPATPVWKGGCDTTGSAYGVHVASTYAYVADGEAGLQVIDVSDPSSPVWKGGCNTTGFASGVYPLGNYAYVADGSGEHEAGGLQVIDVSTPNWYYFPSLMVNAGEQRAIGFSGPSEASYVGAYYCWRSGTMDGPVLIKAGKDYSDHGYWGDYSCTSLDPSIK